MHAQRLKELNQAVRLVADAALRRTLSGDEATTLLEVVAEDECRLSCQACRWCGQEWTL